MIDPSPPDDELLALEAVLDAADDPDAALARLANRTDPDSIAAKFAILVPAHRLDEALSLIDGIPLNAKWIDKAVGAFAAKGNVRAARDLTEQFVNAHPEELVTRFRCIGAVCEGVLDFCLRSAGDGESKKVTPLSLSERDLTALREASTFASPVIEHFRIRAPANKLEAMLVEHSLVIAFLLSNETLSKVCGGILAQVKPVSLELAKAVLRGQLAAWPDLPHRLRVEHPSSFEAQLLAAQVEGTVLKEPEKAVLSAMGLIGTAQAKDKAQLGSLLHELMGYVSHETASQVRKVLDTLWPKDSAFLQLLQAEELIGRSEFEAARQLVATLRNDDDAHWLQLDAQLHLAEGRIQEAISQFSRAIEIVPHPALMKQVASLAASINDWDTAQAILAKLRILQPKSPEVLLNQASACIKQGDNQKAAECFRQLYELQPTEVHHQLNQAISLARAGDLEGSLAVFERIEQPSDFALEALLGKSQVLEALDRSDQAFALLADVKEVWWGESRFVAQYMTACHRTKNEEQAHEALRRLQELDRLAEPAERSLKAFSIEDLKNHVEAFNERRDYLLQQLLLGRIPWLMVDDNLRQVPYLAWAYRTMPVRWLFEAPLEWAQRTLYATHAFAIEPRNSHPHLVELVAPPAGTKVVADLSALITLHRLDLLGVAADYFGAVLYPSQYLTQILRDSIRLRPHQLSQYTSPNFVRRALETGRLKVCEDNALPAVDEHSPDVGGQHLYRLIDVALLLYNEGIIGEAENSRLLAVCHQESGVDGSHAQIRLGDRLRFGLSTLETLDTLGFADQTLDALEVFISAEDRERAIQTVQAFDFSKQVADWNTHLWDSIRANNRFVPQVAPSKDNGSQVAEAQENDGDNTTETDDEPMWPITSAMIAAKLGVHLFADDRAAQVLFWTEVGKDSPNAFSTDRLIEALMAAGRLTAPKAAECYLQLLRWRYRFVVVPGPILKVYADQFRKALPGRHLKEVAEYVQDSMHDPGLLGGMEKTEPPTSMAAALFHAWCRSISRFVVAVWEDETFEEADAIALTTWTFSNLLPSAPVAPPGIVQRVLAETTPRSILGNVLLEMTRSTTSKRAQTALKAMSAALGMTSDDYMFTIAELLNVEYGNS